MPIDYWGELCVTPELASVWADEFIVNVKMIWCANYEPGSYYKGTSDCFSSLFKAGRYDDILELLEMAPHKYWHYHKWGVKALAERGEIDRAIQYAENSQNINDHSFHVAEVCEEVLLENNRAHEAYSLYAIQANQKQTYVATFRAIKKNYPQVEPEQILSDLIASTPGEDGKWFASAVSVGLYDKAARKQLKEFAT